jgi:exodeoxyribonuclease VII small subunit
MPKTTKTSEEALPFEEALEQIQQIGRELEDGSLGLEESLERFESGIRLIRQCHATLERAEQRIKILTDVDAEGNPKLEDFDATATLQQNKQSAGRRKKKSEDTSDDDPSSLF